MIQMVVFYGQRLYGKVDVVPGVGHVATQFFYVQFLPLIPLGSYLVLDESGDDFRGVSIFLSFKSILVAWLRFAFFIGGLIGIVAGIALCLSNNGLLAGLGALVLGIFALVAFFASYQVTGIGQATYHRAIQLAQVLGSPPELLLQLEVAYGRKTAAEADAELGRMYETGEASPLN